MDAKTLRGFVVIATLLLVAAFIFLCIESKGRFVESRIGIIGIVVIAAMLFLSAFVTPKSKDQNPNPDHDET